MSKYISSKIVQEYNNWHRGFVNSFWSKNSYTSLEYENPKPFNNLRDVKKWKKLGFGGNKFSGHLCNMNKRQPKYSKDFIEWFERCYNAKDVGISYYMMPTGVILPTHKDTFKKYRELFKCPIKKIIRAVVFLDDWNPGHIFEIDGYSITGYKKGDYVCWKGSTPHMAANIGVTKRYTMQITGHI